MNVDGVWIPRFKSGTFFGAPAPAVTIIFVEELRQARQKRTQSAHVLGVPRLLWSEWRIHIYKSADLIIDIPAGYGEIWPIDMHETLMIVICFPYLNRSPWELRKTKLFVGMGRYLKSVFKTSYRLGGCILSQLCKKTRGMGTLPFGLLRKLLSLGVIPTLPGK